MSRSYLIWAPPFCRSAGVRSLYRLAEILQERGLKVTLWSWGNSRQPGFEYTQRITPQMQEHDVVVYPEIVTGNPLQVRNVARWVLFFPGKLGGECSYHPSEKIFTWSDDYYPGAPRLFLDVIDRTLFYNAGLPRTQNCTFVYKGGKWKQIPELDCLTEITMQWPGTRKELAHLLQTTKTLYSWDAHSLLNDEAYLCGVQVKLITERGFEDFKPGLIFSEEIFEKELEFFIEETQHMDYQGAMQPWHTNTLRQLQASKRKLTLWRMLQKICSSRKISNRVIHYTEKLREMGVSD